MLVLAALGRSALASPDLPSLEARIRRIAHSLEPVARSHQLVVMHAAGALHASAGLPADLRAAQSCGLVGHLLARELHNVAPAATVTSVLVQALVSGDGSGVPAAPVRIVEAAMLQELAERDDRILCVGCVPVRHDADARLAGCEALLDYDQAAASLGIELGADALLLLADVPAVFAHWPQRTAPMPSFAAHDSVPTSLDSTSIGGTLRAACRFAGIPGTFAAIGAADQSEALLAGRAGTWISLTPPARADSGSG